MLPGMNECAEGGLTTHQIQHPDGAALLYARAFIDKQTRHCILPGMNKWGGLQTHKVSRQLAQLQQLMAMMVCCKRLLRSSATLSSLILCSVC